MRLDDYLKEKKLSQAALGALLDPPVTQSLVSQWIRGTARVMLEQAVQIEMLTAGAVRPADLADMHKSRTPTEQAAA
ncbi:helix-turn-helix domain-containing protein [Paraburkholderia madseniana]|uniref:Helix-turn-helix domain-containing protein n=1 Tax=Paraburkholderia madseniana TaxID=2599607 RepID=A0A6N6WBP9_9BURK|nr:YdaS family helix-turn-helix protein [Paraburkholderia madseniana]KAE8757338.1 helix-turn-helix domain-containing protein [Paraburkholderia madseniana]